MSNRSVKSYRVLVGMEIHVQLATDSKMFTGAANGVRLAPSPTRRWMSRCSACPACCR